MKLPYSFHPLAERQQDEIWHYTYQNWGIERADSYIDGLHEKLALAASTKISLLNKIPPEIANDVYFFRYESHYVFVKKVSKPIEVNIRVLSILHSKMNIPIRLSQALEKL